MFAPTTKKTTTTPHGAENGINENTIAKWLGHGNPSTTKKYYIDVLSDFEKEQAQKINTIFDTKFDPHFDPPIF